MFINVNKQKILKEISFPTASKAICFSQQQTRPWYSLSRGWRQMSCSRSRSINETEINHSRETFVSPFIRFTFKHQISHAFSLQVKVQHFLVWAQQVRFGDAADGVLLHGNVFVAQWVYATDFFCGETLISKHYNERCN